MNKKIYVINGSGGVGKDLFVKYVTENSLNMFSTHNSVRNYSSVSKVKKIAWDIGWSGLKTEKDRKFLSDLKILTTEYNDMSFNDMRREISSFWNDGDAWALFLHIREPEEIARIVNGYSAKTILVKRDSVEHITSNMADKNVFNYRYDIVIDNDGTMEELNTKAMNFVVQEAICTQI
jgi:hypothetical protein